MEHKFVVINVSSGRSIEISRGPMNEVRELVRNAVAELEKDGKYCIIRVKGGINDGNN